MSATNYEGHFPIVCVGGSAGGLDAYTRLLSCLNPDLGVAIVFINHLRTMNTQLHEILPRFTSMPIDLITNGMTLERNHVYIIPSGNDLEVCNGSFRLTQLSKPYGWPNVITIFLLSIARKWHGKIIAVIVSGNGRDGAEALKEISRTGTITIAQKPDTAGQRDMPDSAIATGYVDFILSPEDIALKINELAGR